VLSALGRSCRRSHLRSRSRRSCCSHCSRNLRSHHRSRRSHRYRSSRTLRNLQTEHIISSELPHASLRLRGENQSNHHSPGRSHNLHSLGYPSPGCRSHLEQNRGSLELQLVLVCMQGTGEKSAFSEVWYKTSSYQLSSRTG